MANTRSHNLGPGLSKAEQIAGFCYLPVYAVLLPWGIQALSQWLGLGLSDLQINLCYFILNCAAVWIIFHNFLLRSFRNIRFWELVQALILGFVLYYAGTILFSRLMAFLDIQVVVYNDQTVQGLYQQSRPVMLVCGLVIAPMVEETLVRGLIFGVIRRRSRIAAYCISVLFFALLHVWQYLLSYDPGSVALAALAYIPAGIALAWTYEKANTIWAPIGLHMAVNAMAFGLLPG